MIAWDSIAGEYGVTRNLIIYSGKGGSGKTTAAQNLASWLASLGRIVVLADTDIHAMASNFIDMTAIPEDERYTLTDVIQSGKPLSKAMYQVRKGLYVIPSDSNIGSANNWIVINEAQEVMLDRFSELTSTLSAPPRRTPTLYREEMISLRKFKPLPRVSAEEVRELPPFIEYIVWDFAADPGALGRAIMQLPNSEIWAPIVLEPMPWLAFEQMKASINTLFKNRPQQKPPIKGVIPFDLTHKKDFTTKYLVELLTMHPGEVTRAVHDDGFVPESQDQYPAQTVFEFKRSSRAAKEMFEIALIVDGYTGQVEGSPVCKSCNDIRAWVEEQSLLAMQERGA